MPKIGSDVQNGIADAYWGYLPEGNIWGFSMMHKSGTGGAPKYGVVSQVPVIGLAYTLLADLSQPRASADEGGAGWYKSSLTNGITIELAASEHAGLYSYTLPKANNASPSIVVNVSHVLQSFRGLGGAVNWQDGFSAMQTNAEVTPPLETVDPRAPDASTKEGRGALPDWLQYGYITSRFTRAVSRAVEYSTNDFGLYQVAAGLGKTEDGATYLNRSRNWRNHWNPNAISEGHNGSMVPRSANGSFIPQDPKDCGGCY
ncbi:hypothetical protein E8E12_000587 [Didymella heteroderae]|uniref:Glycosyl hydrolase family 92 domain-containing protein n=1 Tax=Didymella heteroderae TaxID=1769908 RepID=A0A9P4WS05_9PLEO|nr:hypothetical protein E8E12_000587 [Didymella heteroderae]